MKNKYECINNVDFEKILTIGKTYEGDNETPINGYIYIKDDFGIERLISSTIFKLVEDK